MFANRLRRVHGDGTTGTYSQSGAAPRRLHRQESGKVTKRQSAAAHDARTALVNAVQAALVARRYPVALGHILDLIVREPNEPRWQQKYGEVLRILGRDREAAAAYRRAARRYEAAGLAAHASAVERVAEMLDGAAPTRGVVRLSDHRATQPVDRDESTNVTVRPPILED